MRSPTPPTPLTRKQAIAMLKRGAEGVAKWNRYREAGGAVPHLSGAHLSRADLSSANLSGAHLSRADLRRANLSGAHLSRADLSSANLSGADLHQASLMRAQCHNADFSGADLRETVLAAVDGSAAECSGAHFLGASFTAPGEGHAGSGFLELSVCVGLEDAHFDEGFLNSYMEAAFEYAHQPELAEAERYPALVTRALQRIKLLRSLYAAESDPPPELVEVIGVITDELIAYLKKHPESMHSIRPRQFEELVAEILASFGWEVRLTPQTRDGGYDIFAVSKSVGGVETSWLVECKRHRADREVTVDVARALFGVKGQLNVGMAMLATTSFFAKGVHDYKASRYDLELRDYEGILEWINEYKPNPGGKLYVKDNRLILPGEE